MWNTCSCHREKRKSENLETGLYDKLFRLVASTTIKLHVWVYQMSHKAALLTFLSLFVLRKHRTDPGLVHLNWPVWDSKKNIPSGRRGGISLLKCWIAISPSRVERLPSFSPLRVAVWTVQTPLTVTWMNYNASCPILFRSDPWWCYNFLKRGESDVSRGFIFPGKNSLFAKTFWRWAESVWKIVSLTLHCKK